MLLPDHRMKPPGLGRRMVKGPASRRFARQLMRTGYTAWSMNHRCLLARATILLLASLSLACGHQKVETPEEAAGAMIALGQRRNSDAFVIFEALPSRQAVQFFNGGDSLFFDVVVTSVWIKGLPDVLRMGEVVEAPPQLEGQTTVRALLTHEQRERLRAVLRRHALDDHIKYQLAYGPDDRLGGWFELLRGPYTLPPARTHAFLEAVFRDGFGLEEFSIRMTEN